MVKKFEAFSKGELKNDYYLGDDDKEFKSKDISISNSLENIATKDEAKNYIRERLSSLKWQDIVVKKVGRDEEDEIDNYICSLPQSITNELNHLQSKFEEGMGFNTKFKMFIDYSDNRTHFPDSLHPFFKGIGLGYKCYKAMVKRLGYITSDWTASDSAKNVWKYLIKDPELYAVIGDSSVMVISKELSDEKVAQMIRWFVRKKFNFTSKEFLPDEIKLLAKTNKIIKVDSELAKKFKHLNINKLNSDLFKRWKAFHIRAKSNIDSKYKIAKISQKISIIETDEEMYIVGIAKYGSNYYYKLDNGIDGYNRNAFVVLTEPEIITEINCGDFVTYGNDHYEQINKLEAVSDTKIIADGKYDISKAHRIEAEECSLEDIKKGDTVLVRTHGNYFKKGTVLDVDDTLAEIELEDTEIVLQNKNRSPIFVKVIK